MKSAVRFMHYFAALYAPIGFTTIFEPLLWPPVLTRGVFGHDWAPTVFGLLLLAWFLAAVATIVRLILDRDFREEVLIGLVGLRERDEREEAIVGGAARASFFATVAATIALLFLSLFTYVDYHNPRENGFAFVVELGKIALVKAPHANRAATSYPMLPLSTIGLLLLLLLVQLVSFAAFSRTTPKAP